MGEFEYDIQQTANNTFYFSSLFLTLLLFFFTLLNLSTVKTKQKKNMI